VPTIKTHKRESEKVAGTKKRKVIFHL